MKARKKKPTVRFCVRLPAKTFEKLGWLAASRELNKATLVRLLVSDAVKDARPPANAQTLEVLANPVWDKLADEAGIPLEKLIPQLLDRMSVE